MYLIYINYFISMLYIYNKLVCTLYSLHEGDSCYACYFPAQIIGFYGEKPVLLLVNNSPIYWGVEQTTFFFPLFTPSGWFHIRRKMYEVFV
jgi:hypothetical protein